MGSKEFARIFLYFSILKSRQLQAIVSNIRTSPREGVKVTGREGEGEGE